MIDPGVAESLVSAADASAVRALAALERQGSALTALRNRVRDAMLLAPAAAEPDWRSPAQLFYESGLARLLSSLATAESSVDEALAETRRAVSSLSARS